MPKPKSSPASIDLDLYEAVFAALAGYRPGYVVSTHKAIAAARKRLPKASRISDEALIKLLVSVAITNQMLVSFDHN